MSMVELVLSIGGFSVVLVVLVIIFISKSKSNKIEKKRELNTGPKPSFEKLKNIIKKKDISSGELKQTLDSILEYYGKIPAKKDYMPHDDFKQYMEVIFIMCRHPKTTKDIIRNFEKSLSAKNSTYAKEIDKAVNNGLNARV